MDQELNDQEEHLEKEYQDQQEKLSWQSSLEDRAGWM